MKSDHRSVAHLIARAISIIRQRAAMIPKIALGAVAVMLAVLPFNLASSSSSAGSASPVFAGNQREELKSTQAALPFKQLTFKLDPSGGNKPIVLPKTDGLVRIEISITNIVFAADPKHNAKEEAAHPILLIGMIVRDPTSGLIRYRVGALNPCPKPASSSPATLVNLDCDYANETTREGEMIASVAADLQLDTKTGELALVTKTHGITVWPKCCINLWF